MSVPTTRSDDLASTLTPLAPDATRAARTRDRCRAALSSGARRRARYESMQARAADFVTPMIVVAGGLFYAVVFIANTLRLETLVR